jgi:hypothetical protein
VALAEGKWVRLSGDTFDLEAVAAAFDDPPNVSFMRDGAEWWIGSNLFDPLVDADELRRAAKDLVATLNGCASVMWSNHEAISADNVVFMEDAGEGRPGQVVHLGHGDPAGWGEVVTPRRGGLVTRVSSA